MDDITLSEANSIIHQNNKDHDTEITFDEFCVMWNKFKNKF